MADKTTQRIAVVQVRGTIGATGNAKATLRSLRLHRQNYCCSNLQAHNLQRKCLLSLRMLPDRLSFRKCIL